MIDRSGPDRRRTSWIALATLAAASALAITPLAAGQAGLRSTGPIQTVQQIRGPEFVPDRIVVKFADPVTYCPSCPVRGGQRFTAGSEDGPRLRSLQQQARVVDARPLFRGAAAERALFVGRPRLTGTEIRGARARVNEAARRRFPIRERRAARQPLLPDLHHVYVLELEPGTDPVIAAARFADHPQVHYAHPDYRMDLLLVPDDPFYHSAGSWKQDYDDLWGLKADHLDMARAWDRSLGDGELVAVVDSGVDYRHEDLAANVWQNPLEVAGNQVDDDGNGFVDDVRGWDFTTCKEFDAEGCAIEKARDDDPTDEHGHGTHVAGTIAAVGGNGRGIVGVAPAARIMAVRGLNADGGGASSDLAAAILYAVENGATIINNSWGCGLCPSVPVTEEAVATAHALGVVVVFAAGNSGLDMRARSPQNLRSPKPIVVAASAPTDEPTYFTSFGAGVDVAAPGGSAIWGGDANILSLWRKGPCRGCPRLVVKKKYVRLQGTSMAAPHVSGAAALLLAQRPELTPDEVRQILRASSADIQDVGWDATSGAGGVRPVEALRATHPLDVSIRTPARNTLAGGRRVVVRGTAAGEGFAEYELQSRPERYGEWRDVKRSGAHVTAGTLGRVKVKSLDMGWNLIRLSANAGDGRIYEDVVSVGRQGRLVQVGKKLDGMAYAPDVSGSRIVWSQLDKPVVNLTGHIYLHDTRSGRTVQLSETAARGARPRISGDRVVWHSTPKSDGASVMFTCQIDSVTGLCPVERIGVEGTIPKIAGSRVVYRGDSSLATIDVASGAVRVLDDRTLDYDIEGDIVAWRARVSGSEAQLRYFDAAANSIQTFASYDKIFSLAVSGREIFYTAVHEGKDPRPPLRAYHIDTGDTRVVVDPMTFTTHLDSSPGGVVWSELSDIVVHDVGASRTNAVALHPLVVRGSPAISSRLATWIDIQHGAVPAGELWYTRLAGDSR